MRVCHIWDKFYPTIAGGVERYLLSLTQYLAKNRQIEFSLITDQSKFLNFTKKIPKFEDTGYLKVYRLGPQPIDVINGAVYYATKRTPRFLWKIKLISQCNQAVHLDFANPIDLFHVHGLWNDLDYASISRYLGLCFNKPLVVTLHGGFIGDVAFGGMPLEHPYLQKFLKNDVAAITTYSQEVLDGLRILGFEEKSFLIRNFVDTKKFAKPKTVQPHDLTLIFVSRLEVLQHPELIVEAFRRVNKQFPNTKLHIVGSGSLFEKTQKLVRDLNLKDSVVFFGKQTDVRKFLWNSDIFLASNFGYIASLEAWSAGLVVVAPNFGVMKETIKDGYNGLLFTPQNVNALTAAIIRLIEDKPLRERLAANGKRTVREYDIGTVAPKIADIYESVAKK
ncbi:MAG: glycosyltransferase family 4 protein [Candidatus Bathyarchaeota archaeon]|nr:glycosyltransferase family 4 protein [Candidatus Bathyarchaeota archaeon]